MMDPPVIPRERLDDFMDEVFHNIQELHSHHCRLVERFHKIQREEHPTIRSLATAMLDAALNFRDPYLKYVPNYPIAAYRIDNELATNSAFKSFHEVLSLKSAG
jgi:RHO1 GDP-GTP exchange protein 1/2